MASIRAFAVLALVALTSSACCHSTCASEAAPPHSVVDPGGIVTVSTDAGIVCTGTIIRAEKIEQGWLHQVLTARHCFGEYKGELPRAEVRALVDGGYEDFNAQLQVWSERSVNYAGPIAVGFDTVKWQADDWAIVVFGATVRLRTIPLAQEQEAAALKKGELVAMASYIDRQWWMKLRYHTHDFAWGDVPPELSEDGHSGSPILRHGEVTGIYVAAVTNSAVCTFLFGCRDRAGEYVSTASIRASAHRQGYLVDDR